MFVPVIYELCKLYTRISSIDNEVLALLISYRILTSYVALNNSKKHFRTVSIFNTRK